MIKSLSFMPFVIPNMSFAPLIRSHILPVKLISAVTHGGTMRNVEVVVARPCMTAVPSGTEMPSSALRRKLFISKCSNAWNQHCRRSNCRRELLLVHIIIPFLNNYLTDAAASISLCALVYITFFELSQKISLKKKKKKKQTVWRNPLKTKARKAEFRRGASNFIIFNSDTDS